MEDKMAALLSLSGLDEREARLYLFILREGRRSASECAKFLGIARMEAYRVLRSMEEKGAVFSVPGRPVRYEAEPIEVFTSASMERTLALLKRMEAAREELVSLASKLPKSGETIRERFKIVQGREQIYRAVERMASSSSEKISMLLTRNDVSQLYVSGMFDRLASGRDRPRVRMITSIDEGIYDIASELSKTMDLRHSQAAENGRLVISDGRSVLSSLVLDSSPGLRSERDVAISVESRDYARMMESLFEVSFSASSSSSDRFLSLRAAREASSKLEATVSVLKAVSAERGWSITSPLELEVEGGRRLSFTFMLSSAGKKVYGDVVVCGTVQEVRQHAFAAVAKKIQLGEGDVVLVMQPYDDETERVCSMFGIKTFRGSDPVEAVSSIRELLS